LTSSFFFNTALQETNNSSVNFKWIPTGTHSSSFNLHWYVARYAPLCSVMLLYAPLCSVISASLCASFLLASNLFFFLCFSFWYFIIFIHYFSLRLSVMYAFLCVRQCFWYSVPYVCFCKRRCPQWRASTQNYFYLCTGIGGSSGNDSEAAVGIVPQLDYGLSFQIFSK
jgi:hypothetical protein